ncbi:carbohydrate ABC transporter permease [Cellulosilyticum ruminicola]|uniref:carbohydrate ABC transporter permease n=1 Tax=Cellulosilyticum ruminicola TaxID=425254 RepID=UPI0006D24393|nr:sugar ABC transporter permease [Cellulosilyticum ruminicola]
MSIIATVKSKKVVDYKKQRQREKNITIITFTCIPLVLLILFSFIPLGSMFYYGLTSWNGTAPNKEFVGFQNYVTIFTKPEYFEVFKVSIYYFVGSFVQLALALYFATILTSGVRYQNLFKGFLFFPYLINGVAIGFIFLYCLKQGGTLDIILTKIGLGSLIQKWLGNAKIINYSMAGVSIWRYMGNNLIMFIGAIQSISDEIYEAAELDGASRWQQFKYIIMPSIKRIVQLNLLLAINGALAVFEIPYVMLQGANGSKTFVIQTIETAFQFKKVGLGSAMGIVLLMIVVVIAIIQNVFFKEEEAEMYD